MVGYSKEVFSSEMGIRYTWFLIPLFGPYIGALLGALVYFVFIGFHIKDQPLTQLLPTININFPMKTASLAEFDDDLDEESIGDYTDKI